MLAKGKPYGQGILKGGLAHLEHLYTGSKYPRLPDVVQHPIGVENSEDDTNMLTLIKCKL